MVMKELLENIDKYLALPKDHKRDFLDQLYQYLVNSKATAVDYQRVKSNRLQLYVQIAEVKMSSKLGKEMADKFTNVKLVVINSVRLLAPLSIVCENIH